jgi:hypothetical protein
LAAFSCALALAPARSATVVDEQFTDGSRTNQAPPGSLAWYSARETTNAVVAGQQLVLSNMNSALAYGVLGYFTNSGSSLALSPGDKLELTFDYRFALADANDWGFYFGLYNSGGSRYTNDTSSFNNAAYNGWRGYVGAGIFGNSGSARYRVAERTLTANNLVRNSEYTVIGASVAQTGATNPGSVYQARLTLSYLGLTNMMLETSLGGQVLSNRFDTLSVLTNFDAIVIAPTRPLGNFSLDNVSLVLTTAIPEPPALALLGAAPLLLVALRRRASR